MRQISKWRLEPEPVWISCKTIQEVPTGKEFLVQFDANGKEHTAFVPERFINIGKGGLQGFIIADFDGGSLVDIPVDTFISGPRIMVMDEERAYVLVSS